jgi:hypothetical protein
VTGEGTKHTALAADETWSAATSPHIIETQLAIPKGVTLTLEPCAVVRLAPAGGILVEGKLLGAGLADKKITVERLDASKPWTKIEVRSGEMRLAHAVVRGGGDPSSSDPSTEAMVDVRGDQEQPTQPLVHVESVTLRDSKSLGLLVREGGGFAAGSKELTVTGSASYPIRTWGRAAGTLPRGTYSANAIDEVAINASGGRDDVQEDTTLPNLGVPYRIAGPSFIVRSATAVSLLTIEKGTTLRFSKSSRMIVDATTTDAAATGALVADGVTFTSAVATPQAGDWVGIMFRGILDARNKIANSKISYAGADSQASSYGCPSEMATSFGNDAAVLILGHRPSGAFVTSTTIEKSLGDGIVRGWTGDEVDFLATNTFTDVARCFQTFPKPASAVCPDTTPCPR